MMGIPVLGILDYGTLGFSDLPRLISSGILFLIAFPVGMSAIYQLSFKQTLGLKGKFTISGVYSFSRNPQYVTHVLLVAAIVLATNSSLTLIVGIPYSLWFILAPFSKKQWFKDQFGEEYNSYCHRGPRYIGFPKNRQRKPTRIHSRILGRILKSIRRKSHSIELGDCSNLPAGIRCRRSGVFCLSGNY